MRIFRTAQLKNHVIPDHNLLISGHCDNSRDRSINRYYDPTTDQFISVDPMVQTTDQPYAFVNDDPLNLSDALGIRPAPPAMATPVVKVNLKPTSGSRVSLSGDQSVRIPVGTGTLTVTNTITVSGKKASSTIVDINGRTGDVTASAGGFSAIMSPSSIGEASPTFSWGSLTTQGLQYSTTSTRSVDGVKVTDATTTQYDPSGFGDAEAVGVIGGAAVVTVVAGAGVVAWNFFSKDAFAFG